jgi:cytochrome P450
MSRVGKKIVAARFGPDGKDERDMLVSLTLYLQIIEVLMMSQGAFVRHGLTQAECETEALFQILAGSDTTATAIRATMLHIITTPRVYQALKKEISEGIRGGKISNPIIYDEARKLPYLQVRSILFFFSAP